MPRLPANNRLPAINRRPVIIPRKVLGFQNDGKLHVVLDTNIIIYGLKAKSKEIGADSREKNCLKILKAWEEGRISVGFNHLLFKEYSKISEPGISEILKLAEKSPFLRMLVDPPDASKDKNDNHLFNGLSADYLVSENWKDIRPDKLKIFPPYKSIMKPEDFISVL